jgi:hypothetical protein
MEILHGKTLGTGENSRTRLVGIPGTGCFIVLARQEFLSFPSVQGSKVGFYLRRRL